MIIPVVAVSRVQQVVDFDYFGYRWHGHYISVHCIIVPLINNKQTLDQHVSPFHYL